MSRSASLRRPEVLAALVSSVVLSASVPAAAQVLCEYPTVSARVPGACADAPPLCNGASTYPAPGVIEFDVYSSERCGLSLSGMRFGLTWPAAWTVSTCARQAKSPPRYSSSSTPSRSALPWPRSCNASSFWAT